MKSSRKAFTDHGDPRTTRLSKKERSTTQLNIEKNRGKKRSIDLKIVDEFQFQLYFSFVVLVVIFFLTDRKEKNSQSLG